MGILSRADRIYSPIRPSSHRFPSDLKSLAMSLTTLHATAFGCLIVAVHCLNPAIAPAQLSSAERDRLLAEITSTGERFNSDRLPDLTIARQRAVAGIDRVRQWFAARTDRANYAAWMAYLRLDPLVEAIETEQPVAAQARQALALRKRLVGPSPGLEMEVFGRLRDDLDQLLAASRFADREKAPELFRRQLGILSERTAKLESVPAAEEQAAVSRILQVLEETGQSDRLLASFHDAFSQPNVVVRLSESMIQETAGRPVDRDEPVRDCILGTRLIGRARMEGTITVDLLPSADTARLAISLDGRVNTRNTGYNGPVRLRSIGNGEVHASRTIQLSDRGVALEEPQTTASLRTRITAIEHHLRLVRKIARKRAAQQKPHVDRIALGRLRDRVGSRFTEQTAAIGRSDAFTRGDPWLQRLDIPEPTQHWSSTDDLLFFRAAVSRSSQLAAPLPAPSVPEGLGATVQVHESAVDNALAQFLGGRTVKQDQIDRLLESLGRETTGRELELTKQVESESPFEIDFARLRPIIFEAREDTVRLGIRGTRFEQDGRQLVRPLEITAVYRPASSDPGNAGEAGTTTLVRESEVNVDFPGRGRLTVGQTALRSTIKRAFDDVFPETLLDRRVSVPESSPLEAMRGQVFHPRYVQARDGWLTIAVH